MYYSYLQLSLPPHPFFYVCDWCLILRIKLTKLRLLVDLKNKDRMLRIFWKVPCEN